jgi:hypothetical protein
MRLPGGRVGIVSARLAALVFAVVVVVGIGIYLLADIPVFYAACGIVAFVAILLAVGLDADPGVRG